MSSHSGAVVERMADAVEVVEEMVGPLDSVFLIVERRRMSTRVGCGDIGMMRAQCSRSMPMPMPMPMLRRAVMVGWVMSEQQSSCEC